MRRERIGDLLLKFSRKEKVPQSEFAPFGETPIVDQSSGTLVVGYTDNPDARHESPLPITLFGDHTREVKYIGFPFASGADGTQLLYPNTPDLDPTYFYYAVRNVDLSNYFYARHFKFLKEQFVNIPALRAQLRIADRLKAYDDLIENDRRRMALLEEAARRLYREWFVRLRFPGHEHTRITNGVPEGWERAPFEAALVLQRGFDLPVQDREDGDVPVYGSTGINGFHSKAKVGGPGVVTGRSGTLGEVHYVPSDFWPLNTSLWVKEFKRVSPLFAVFLLREMDLRQYNGGVSVPTLDRKTVHKAEILIPAGGLLTSFDEFAGPLFQQINTLASQVERLRATRDLLLPRLMSGEIAV